MKDRSDDPSHHERMLLPWSYISLGGGGGGGVKELYLVSDMLRYERGTVLLEKSQQVVQQFPDV